MSGEYFNTFIRPSLRQDSINYVMSELNITDEQALNLLDVWVKQDMIGAGSPLYTFVETIKRLRSSPDN